MPIDTESPTARPLGASFGDDSRQRLTEAVEAAESALGGRVAMCLRDGARLAFDYRAEELFHAASTMKVPVMIEVFRQVDAGAFSLAETMVLDPLCRSFIDDSPFRCEPAKALQPRIGQPVSVLELATQMIVLSDNLATNLLLERVGARRITATMRALGATGGYVLRGVEDEQAFRAGISNRVTAHDLTLLMAAIEEDRAASPESCAEMRRILRLQQYRDMIAAGLPEGVELGSKTGSINGVRHDTAIVYAAPGTYYLTILMDGLKDCDAAMRKAAELSRLVYGELVS